jgi:hypothetical protein
VSTVDEVEAGSAQSTAETVAGFLAAMAMAAALIALAWHPLRLLAPALVMSLLAAGIGGRAKRIAFASVMTVAACFFFAMMITVITSRPLW